MEEKMLYVIYEPDDITADVKVESFALTPNGDGYQTDKPIYLNKIASTSYISIKELDCMRRLWAGTVYYYTDYSSYVHSVDRIIKRRLTAIQLQLDALNAARHQLSVLVHAVDTDKLQHEGDTTHLKAFVCTVEHYSGEKETCRVFATDANEARVQLMKQYPDCFVHAAVPLKDYQEE